MERWAAPGVLGAREALLALGVPSQRLLVGVRELLDLFCGTGNTFAGALDNLGKLYRIADKTRLTTRPLQFVSY